MIVRTRSFHCVILAFILLFTVTRAGAQEVHGMGDVGIWFLHNNIKSNSDVTDDGVNENHIFDNYSLMYLGLKLDGTQLNDGRQPFELNAHFKGKMFLRLTDSQYTLGFDEQTRQELDELNIEMKKLGSDALALWFGRQLVYESGGALFDGVRGIYSINKNVDIALYGGLNADPRQLTGYIGPSYRSNPFSVDFQTVGVYSTYRTDRFKGDAAFRSDLFKGSLDRVSLFTQADYLLNSFWSFSGLFDVDLAGRPGLNNLSAYITARPLPSVTNTLSFSRWSALQYKASDASAIPPPTGISTTNIGTEVNGTSYNAVREHVMLKVFDRNYIFAAFQFARRTFDNLNQFKYTLGYRDPQLFGAPYDLRVQTDLIDNYRGFNTAFDILFGRDWNGGIVRLEGGATMYANERDIYVNNLLDPTAARQTDKEYSIKLNGYYSPNRTVAWGLQYALHKETDATNENQNVLSHDVYLSSNFRF